MENVNNIYNLSFVFAKLAATNVPTTYKDAKIVVQSGHKKYFASWYLNEKLIPVIILDPPVADAVSAGKLDIDYTLEHEYDEAILAMKLAAEVGHNKEYMLQNYTGTKPKKKRELDEFGGEAHEILRAKDSGFDALEKKEWDIVYKRSDENDAPLEPYSWTSLHSQQIRELTKGRDVVVYHGTSSKKLAKILVHGSLDPAISGGHKTFKESSPGIFITKQPGGLMGAEFYAYISSEGGSDKERTPGDNSDAVVLELIVPLNWIETDPDDTKFKESGEINDLGADQGIVRRPLNIKRIKTVLLKGLEVSKIVPEWTPIGIAIDKISKAIKSGKQLPEEYILMSGQKPKGLSRQETYYDIEEKVAKGLTNLHDNWFSPDYKVHEAALVWVLKNKAYGLALPSIKSFFESIGVNFEEFKERTEGSYWWPKPNEYLTNYLKRVA